MNTNYTHSFEDIEVIIKSNIQTILFEKKVIYQETNSKYILIDERSLLVKYLLITWTF